MSLIGGFSAPKITKVLEQSGYLVGPPKLAMRRLFDTGRLMVDACANGPDALRAGGAGWRAAVRVRALHAKVRRRLLRRGGGAEPGSGGGGGGGGGGSGGRWDVETYGVPINQEDMAATLLAFSYNVLVGVEAIRGEELPEAEQEAFLHLWRYMGHLLGVAETHNPCAGGMRLAKARLESIILHLLHPDELSVRVATHLLKAPYAHLCAPRAARGFELSAQMTRLLVGDELGDALGLPFVPRARACAAHAACAACLRPRVRALAARPPSMVQLPKCHGSCDHPPAAIEAHPLAQGGPWGRRRAPAPLGSRREAVAALWCRPNVAHVTAIDHQAPCWWARTGGCYGCCRPSREKRPSRCSARRSRRHSRITWHVGRGGDLAAAPGAACGNYVRSIHRVYARVVQSP